MQSVNFKKTMFANFKKMILIVSMHNFKRVKNCKLIVDGFWLIALSKGLCPSKHIKYFLKKLSVTISISWPSFVTKWLTLQKAHSRTCSTLCGDAHHYFKTFEVKESFRMKKYAYLKNGTWLFDEIKKFWIYTSKTAFSEVSFFNAGNF